MWYGQKRLFVFVVFVFGCSGRGEERRGAWRVMHLLCVVAVPPSPLISSSCCARLTVQPLSERGSDWRTQRLRQRRSALLSPLSSSPPTCSPLSAFCSRCAPLHSAPWRVTWHQHTTVGSQPSASFEFALPADRQHQQWSCLSRRSTSVSDHRMDAYAHAEVDVTLLTGCSAGVQWWRG
jgi:hypothetical protein